MFFSRGEKVAYRDLTNYANIQLPKAVETEVQKEELLQIEDVQSDEDCEKKRKRSVLEEDGKYYISSDRP